MTALGRFLTEARADVAHLPDVVRVPLWFALALGGLGGLAGLALGLWAYPPTAWVAVVELALPAALVGALAALVVVGARRHTRSGRAPS